MGAVDAAALSDVIEVFSLFYPEPTPAIEIGHDPSTGDSLAGEPRYAVATLVASETGLRGLPGDLASSLSRHM